MSGDDAVSDRSALPALVVSACLLGVACTHRQEGKRVAEVEGLATRFRLIAVCPEVAGGLTTPRPAAEQQADGAIRTADGDDVSDAYRRGADQAVALAKAVSAAGAVLKARSPSCGPHEVYDGTFSHRLRSGEGVTAAALRAAGVAVRSEEDIVAGGWVPLSPPGSPEGALPSTGPGA